MDTVKLAILSVLVSVFTFLGVASSATPLESLLPPKDLPEGWVLIDGPRTYTRKTLFERVNGQAELFFKYGFQKSVFGAYKNEKDRDQQIELDIYDMGNVVQAFGIFSRFRNEERPGGVGLESYLDDHSAFFYKGKYFIILYAAESNLDTLTQFSKLISSKISDATPPPKEIGYFPKGGFKPASIQYFPEGLLGKQFLKKGFRGTYVDGEKESHLFLSIFKDSREATNALKFYRENLSKKGKVSSDSLIQFKSRALKGEDPYQGKVMVLQKGFYLLGVVGFEKEEDVLTRLKEFTEKVK